MDYNRIWLAPDAMLLINDGGKKYSSLDEIRQEFHWEHHGEVLPLAHQTAAQAVAAIGGSVATFRVPWGKRAGEARPMLSAADAEFRWPAVVDADAMPSLPQFFWHVAEGNDDTSPLCDVDYYCSTGSYNWQPSSQAGYGMGENAGCRWYSFAELKFPDVSGSNIKMELPATDDGPKTLADGTWTHCPLWSCGNHWLVMSDTREDASPRRGLPCGMPGSEGPSLPGLALAYVTAGARSTPRASATVRYCPSVSRSQLGTSWSIAGSSSLSCLTMTRRPACWPSPWRPRHWSAAQSVWAGVRTIPSSARARSAKAR